jgi:hypothetical protein
MRQIHAGCSRHIYESGANVARTCRASSAQQGIHVTSGHQVIWQTHDDKIANAWGIQIEIHVCKSLKLEIFDK